MARETVMSTPIFDQLLLEMAQHADPPATTPSAPAAPAKSASSSQSSPSPSSPSTPPSPPAPAPPPAAEQDEPRGRRRHRAE